MESQHIIHAFDRDLERIKGLLLEMGGLVEAQLSDAIVALVNRDTKLGKQVKKSDKPINVLEQEINERAVRLLALRQPMADDLRAVIAVMKAAGNLERIGDYAKNIAKRAGVVVKCPPVGSAASTLKRMNDLVIGMINDVLDAFITRDIEAADEVRLRDEEVDIMHNALFRELLTYMMEDPHNITPSMHLLFIAKNIERCGDHTAQIAEQVYYMVSGSMPDEKRPKSDKTATMKVEVKED
ncbi:MAG TPA: phosphate signaling complex protein PhoU [Rhizobiales bacterium]|nr:phosphate signaling complex protein PhoU [Hyphomicrobiales bacterium]